MSVGIVIPFYKNKDQLEKCSKAIRGQSEKNIIKRVVDNSKNNTGFTKACNDGIRELWDSDCEYFILLNQDCYLKPDAVKNMVKFMDDNPKCAIGGIKQIRDGNRDLIVHGGCTEAFPNGRHLGGSVKAGDHSENKRMPWVNGACLIVRRKAIIDIGLMDENFFLICSDSDWCYTARMRGWEVWYIADAECYHEEGVSAKQPDKKTGSIMKLDVVAFRDKWIIDSNFREMSMEIF